jgi:hypothetical protein
MYSSDRHSNNPFLTPNRAQSVSPGPSSPGISRMGSPNHLAYGPRAGMASSPTAYTPSTSQAALLPPQQQGQMHDGAVPLSRQSSASSMNSGDGFFRNGRYAGAASPVGGMSRSSSPMYEGQTLPYGAVAGGARGRGVNEKAGYPGTPSSMAPSMQDKVRLPPSSFPLRALTLRRSSPSLQIQDHGAQTSHPPTQSPTTTCTTPTRNGIGNTITGAASLPPVEPPTLAVSRSSAWRSLFCLRGTRLLLRTRMISQRLWELLILEESIRRVRWRLLLGILD